MSTLLKSKDAAKYLSISVVTLYRLFWRKEIKRTKVGYSTRWPLRELDRYIERQTKLAR